MKITTDPVSEPTYTVIMTLTEMRILKTLMANSHAVGRIGDVIDGMKRDIQRSDLGGHIMLKTEPVTVGTTAKIRLIERDEDE